MKNIYYLIIVLIIPSILAFTKQDSSVKLRPTDSLHKTEANGLSEAIAYKMLYENQIKSNDAILKTIFYALGGLGAAVLLVFGSNWWFNDKKVKDVIKDIDVKINAVTKDVFSELIIKMNTLSVDNTETINQIQKKLQEDVTANITSITLKFTDFTDSIRAELKDDNKALSENYQNQLESFNETYRQQFKLLNDTIIFQYSNLKEIIDEKEKLFMDLILSEQNNRTQALNFVRGDVHRNAFYMWSYGGVYHNALRALFDEIKVMLDRNPNYCSYRVQLQQMNETLDKCKYLYLFDKEEALKILDLIPNNDELIDLKKELLMKIEKIEIYGNS